MSSRRTTTWLPWLPRRRPKQIWTVQVNDLVGGWFVTTYPHPMSEHDYRKDGDSTKRGIDACECHDRDMAYLIARLLNEHEERRHVFPATSKRTVRRQMRRLQREFA